MLTDLMSSEQHLARLGSYDEARDVVSMINKIKPGEEKAFWEAHDAKIQHKRDRMLARHADECKRLDTALKDLRIRARRERAHELNLQHRRLDFHTRSLDHTQALAANRPVEVSVHPVVKDRPGAAQTSAAFRGTQLMSTVQGAKLQMPSLCAIHRDDDAI